MYLRDCLNFFIIDVKKIMFHAIIAQAIEEQAFPID